GDEGGKVRRHEARHGLHPAGVFLGPVHVALQFLVAAKQVVGVHGRLGAGRPTSRPPSVRHPASSSYPRAGPGERTPPVTERRWRIAFFEAVAVPRGRRLAGPRSDPPQGAGPRKRPVAARRARAAGWHGCVSSSASRDLLFVGRFAKPSGQTDGLANRPTKSKQRARTCT